MAQARMQAVSDENVLAQLEQLETVRALVRTWLHAPEASLAAVLGHALGRIETEEVRNAVDKPAARDAVARAYVMRIENLAGLWHHTLTYFDGSNDTAGAAELVERVRTCT
jgi:hypothetical protein